MNPFFLIGGVFVLGFICWVVWEVVWDVFGE